MRLVFLSTAEFGVPVLEALLRSDHQITGVVTGPDKPAGRGRKFQPTPVRIAAEAAGIPVLTPARFKDPEFLDLFASWRPDAAVVVAFRILPPEVFDLPPLGTLNIHPSLLPAYRGPAPIPWALINGETETGMSIIRITSKVDAGGLLLQRRLQILPSETADDLERRLAPVGGEMVLQALEGVASGTLAPLQQDESLVTRAPKLEKNDGQLEWRLDCDQVHNRVRGVTSWPGAFTWYGGNQLKLFDSRIVDNSGSAGEILHVGDELVVGCGSGAVGFRSIQREGKKRMSISEYTRGARLIPGLILGV